MSRYHAPADDDDEAWDDDDFSGTYDGYDSEEDEDEPTVPCPYCRREIHEEANQCPYCERYISREDAPRRQKPWWILVGALLALYGIVHWLWSPW